MGGIRASIRTVSQLRFCRGKTHLPRQINRAWPPSVLGLLPRQCYHLVVPVLFVQLPRQMDQLPGAVGLPRQTIIHHRTFAAANNKQETRTLAEANNEPLHLPGQIHWRRGNEFRTGALIRTAGLGTRLDDPSIIMLTWIIKSRAQTSRRNQSSSSEFVGAAPMDLPRQM